MVNPSLDASINDDRNLLDTWLDNNTNTTDEPIDQGPPGTGATNPEPVEDNWRDLLVFKSDQTIKPNSNKNAGVYLTHHPQIKGLFRKNMFTRSLDVIRKPAWAGALDNTFPRKLDDTDITAAVYWLETHGIFVSPTVTYAGIEISASNIQYDPLLDYINGLHWDGVERLSTWATVLLGAEPSIYNATITRKFLIGSIARALCPGCKMDTMLILEGPQGAKKSTFVEVLYGKIFFTDEIPVLGSKDSMLQLNGHWCIEMGEMTAMTRAESNLIKQWLTRKIDKYRPPYGRLNIEAPRRCVFVGTINPEGGYLRDPTGARRFWPLICVDIDIQKLREIRDQLWAEAAVAYHAGEIWWLETAEEIALAAEQTDDRYESDPWEDTISQYMGLRRSITTAEVMDEALKLPEREWNRGTEIRIGKYLTKLGFVRTRARIEGQAKRSWIYVLK